MKVNIGPYKKDRKVKVKIHKYDTWNADHTLALVILPLLKKLKKYKPGAPLVDDEDVPDKIKVINAPKKENEWDIDKFWFKRWNWVLKEMIWSFEQIIDEEAESQFFKNGIVDFGALKKWEDRKANGFRLFGKYYQSLWT